MCSEYKSVYLSKENQGSVKTESTEETLLYLFIKASEEAQLC
jgi:hypothetical protein